MNPLFIKAVVSLFPPSSKNNFLKAFKAGDYEEAHAYYTRSLRFSPSLLAFNNRAMSGL